VSERGPIHELGSTHEHDPIHKRDATHARGSIQVRLPGGGQALFTTRDTGNLSLAAGIGHQQGRALRDRVCHELRLRWLCAAPQVHGTHVTRLREQAHSGGQPLGEAADGHATALNRVGVMVLAADCVPVVLGSEGAVAAVHAGWRGLAAGVIEEGVRALRELSGDRQIVAAIGPCAGACCYEVGEEVVSAFEPQATRAPAKEVTSAFEPQATRTTAKTMLDLGAIARERLLSAGVSDVLRIDRCTICDQGFFSHRREGALAGRQAAIAWLP
jgi:polyphenol oxidase